jgi:hypothetical protein
VVEAQVEDKPFQAHQLATVKRHNVAKGSLQLRPGDGLTQLQGHALEAVAGQIGYRYRP